jgi:hypothetical protein
MTLTRAAKIFRVVNTCKSVDQYIWEFGKVRDHGLRRIALGRSSTHGRGGPTADRDRQSRTSSSIKIGNGSSCSPGLYAEHVEHHG